MPPVWTTENAVALVASGTGAFAVVWFVGLVAQLPFLAFKRVVFGGISDKNND